MGKVRYFIYMISNKKIVSKPLADFHEAAEYSRKFNAIERVTNVGSGLYNDETKKYEDIRYGIVKV